MAATMTPAKPEETFLSLLDKSKGEFQKLVGDPAKAERIARICRTAYQLDMKLRDCNPLSIIASALKACELGLDPCGARKHAYLIPYGKECQLQISYMGMLELAFRSGAFKAIEARTIHQGDDFNLHYNPEPVFTHTPMGLTGDKSLTHAYAYARLMTGGLVIEVLTRDQIEDVRTKAQSQKVWGPYYVEMAKKTALKKLLKRQPSSVELAEAIEHDNREYDLDRGTVIVRNGGSKAAQLGAALSGQTDPMAALESPSPVDDNPEDFPGSFSIDGK